MEKVALVIGGALLFSAFVLVAAPLGVALGWVAGWTASLFFNELLLGALARIGVHDITLPQAGALLGFVSAFLRTQTTVKESA